MTFLNPVWLLLIIPLAVTFWILKPLSRTLQAIRIIILLLILFSLAGLSVKLPSKSGTIVVVADRSKSMPADAAIKEKEMIDILWSAMKKGDNLAVVSFGQNVAIEHSPQGGKFTDFIADIDPDASSLSEAVKTAVSLIPLQSPGRIIVISDGKWTGANPSSASSFAAARNIPIDYRQLERTSSNDSAVFQIDKPDNVSPGEYFMINIWVQSPVRQNFYYRLTKGTQVIASSEKTFSSGLTRLTFRDKAEQPGTISYNFNVIPQIEDPLPENNTAKFLIGVSGQKALLCVSNSTPSGLADLLKAGQINIQTLSPGLCDWSVEGLSNYSAVLIEDVTAEKIGKAAMENIAAWVSQTGSGLMMTGGKNSFGPGGYFKSPLDPILPVSMELRKEHRKLALAIVVALDRSGSMAMPVGGGKSKIDLADLATVQVLDLLSPIDEFGVIAVDSSAHIIADLAPVEKNIASRGKILSIDSLGGGIFIYEALSNAAKMISTAKSQTKHIILFADAADSEEPGEYEKLLEGCQKAGITVSVIGLGTVKDQDARLLEDIAARGQGQIFFTDSAAELPRLFAQDTIVVSRSTFIEDPTTVKTTAQMYLLTGNQFDISKTIGGYNLCYLRPNANLSAISVDEYQSPIVAYWQTGLGRVLCYTGQANGPYTGDIAKWPDVGSFFTSLAKRVMGDSSQLGPNMLLTQDIAGDLCNIKLHLDPERKSLPFKNSPEVTTLYGLPGKTPQSRSSQMNFEDADTMAVSIPMSGSQTYLSTANIQGYTPLTLSPVCLPYSPEFKPADSHRGLEALSALSQATGGCERVNLTDIWAALPKMPQLIPLSKWLLLTALLLLLLEVLERRTGLLTGRRWKFLPAEMKWWKLLRPERKITAPARKKKTEAAKEQSYEIIQTAPEITPPSPGKEEKKESSLLGALSKAHKRAKTRTDRKE
jgi:Mg-chelatase subunit ChlD